MGDLRIQSYADNISHGHGITCPRTVIHLPTFAQPLAIRELITPSLTPGLSKGETVLLEPSALPGGLFRRQDKKIYGNGNFARSNAIDSTR